MSEQSLPPPSPEAHAHSQELLSYVCQYIDTNGPISFHDYMQEALYSPGLGYYSAGATKFGYAGDFTTAPELTPLFGQTLARQCIDIFDTLSHPDILEIGAGSGALAVSLLQALQTANRLPKNYYILDVSADCKQRQQEKIQAEIPELLPLVKWLDRLPETPIQGIILANEVLDAMPVHKFQLSNNKINEFYVNHHDQKLKWEILPSSNQALLNAVEHLEIKSPDAYESEINLVVSAWITGLSNSLEKGCILLIDYGFPRKEYYFPERHMGTLMCHYQHHAHTDPLILPGIQDITAHVDFTAVAEAAFMNGLTIAGYTHQAAFLASCGIHELMSKNTDQKNCIHTLMHPNEMGELFKCIALTRDIDKPLLGFQLLNQIERL